MPWDKLVWNWDSGKNLLSSQNKEESRELYGKKVQNHGR